VVQWCAILARGWQLLFSSSGGASRCSCCNGGCRCGGRRERRGAVVLMVAAMTGGGVVKMMKTVQVCGFTGEKEDGARCGYDGRALRWFPASLAAVWSPVRWLMVERRWMQAAGW